MKKISLLLVGLLAMFSCEQEGLEGIVRSDVEPVQTRAITSIADFDPIAELSAIPVNILNIGNTACRYLSCAKSGDKVDLYDKDDGSLRQRWILSYNRILLKGGNSLMPPPTVMPGPVVEIVPNSLAGETYPKLQLSYINTLTHGFEMLKNGSCYIYRTPNSSIDSRRMYLQSDTETGSGLKYKLGYNTYLAQWRLVPVGEFRLVDMEYVKSEINGDLINRRDQFIKGAVFSGEPFDVEHTITVSETVRESSTFNETNAVSTQNQTSFHWSSQSGQAPLPVVSFSGDLSTTTTSSRTIGYTSTGGYDVTVSQSFKVVIPANTTCRVEVFKMSYNTILTYVATLEKADGAEAGRKFRIRGQWEGIITTFLYYNIYRDEDNELLYTRILDMEE